jgi:hypothetical protein
MLRKKAKQKINFLHDKKIFQTISFHYNVDNLNNNLTKKQMRNF